MEDIPISFDMVSPQLEILSKNRDIREQLMQYNLDSTIQIAKFRINGRFDGLSVAAYEEALKAFFGSSYLAAQIGASGEASIPLELDAEPLGVGVMNMDFFNRFTEAGIVGPEGRIRGCFDETYDGITVGDLLREFLLNPDSENASTYNDKEQHELIFQLFRLFVVGGALCQPEDSITKYLSITKAVYKEIVTVFRGSESDAIQVSGRAFKIKNIVGLDLFPENPTSPHNTLFVIIDPLKRHMVVVKNTFKSFW